MNIKYCMKFRHFANQVIPLRGDAFWSSYEFLVFILQECHHNETCFFFPELLLYINSLP